MIMGFVERHKYFGQKVFQETSQDEDNKKKKNLIANTDKINQKKI